MLAALVTGASRVIGRAIAERYAADGYNVVVNYHRSEDAAQDVVDSIQQETDVRAVSVQADVSDFDAARGCVEKVVDAFGGLDHIVNNAGVNEHVYTAKLSSEGFDRVMDVNVNGTFNVTKVALPHLEASTVEPEPSIVNISSRLAHTGAPYEPHYASSKTAILGLTKSHAADFASTIRVNAIAPGYIETDMTNATATTEDKEERRQTIPMSRLGQPEDIAHAAAYLRDAAFVTGETLNVNGGQSMQ